MHKHRLWFTLRIKMPPESLLRLSGGIFVSWYLFRREKSWYTENDNSEFMKSEALIL